MDYHVLMSVDLIDSPNKDDVNTINQIIKYVISSTTETKLGALFVNWHEAILAHNALKDTRHKQPYMPIRTYIILAFGH